MATYAIGDVQGCFRSLRKLLKVCDFDPSSDRLWFTGDLVNRGPDSAGVLLWVYEHRKRCRVVLGNHDLHLLARAQGVAKAKRRDTLGEILRSARCAQPLRWLSRRPFIHQKELETSRGLQSFVLVHAGLLPGWTAEDAQRWSDLARKKMRGKKATKLLRRVARCRELTPGKRHTSTRAAAWAVQMLTNLRACDHQGHAALRYNGPPKGLPPNLHPWHDFKSRQKDPHVYVCGHWAAQGLRLESGLIALDSGCVWNGSLSAVRLDDRELFQVDCQD
jgi:bis(5'-nucleosyl)-tetraphosphatase (symmetrical)